MSDEKRSWTQVDLDEEIRRFKAQRSSNYSELVANVKKGKAGAIKSARAMFGRNVIVRALRVKSAAMVSNSPVWQEIADELGLRGQTASRPSAGRSKVGLDVALEKHAEATPESVVDDVIRRETIRLIRTAMAGEEAEATIEKLQRGDFDDEAARDLIDLYSEQRRDDQARNAR
jgi:hypothetical protein